MAAEKKQRKNKDGGFGDGLWVDLVLFIRGARGAGAPRKLNLKITIKKLNLKFQV